MIAWLDEVDPAIATSVAGAKMGRLSELLHLGIAVPQGFSITVDAYHSHCAESGLDAVIEGQLASVALSSEPAELEATAAAIRTAFEETAISQRLTAAIVDAYGELCFRCKEINPPVAVRSSAIGEDGLQASFAGIFNTYLGMSGEQRVLEAVRRCWASLFTARALAYRLELGLSHHDMPMAVGVTELIQAQISGVAFSVHPVTGKPDRIVIEGSWGWGEAIVQGVVTPDHIEVCKVERRVLRYDVAHKAVVSAFDYARGEVREIVMPQRLQDEQVLTEDGIAAIVDAVTRIEEHYGHPVDIEWVVGKGYRPGDPATIVQTRPVTVSSPRGETDDAAGGWNPGRYATEYAFGDG